MNKPKGILKVVLLKDKKRIIIEKNMLYKVTFGYKIFLWKKDFFLNYCIKNLFEIGCFEFQLLNYIN